MPRMRHPSLGFEVPDPIARLIRWIGTDGRRWERAGNALGIGYFASWVADLAGKHREPKKGDPEELGYYRYPFEVVPVLWQGGDGLAFAVVVHDDLPKLEHPMVSYAPSDVGALWLGDDVSSALGNLLAVSIRFAGRGASWKYANASERAEARRDARKDAAALAKTLRVAIPRESKGFNDGARSRRKATPPVPRGYRFKQTKDGVGVLAPTAAFDPKTIKRGDRGLEGEARVGSVLDLARDLLDRGFPASSLAVARDLYRESLAEDSIAPALAMKSAYLALGRDFLARRVDIYVAYHRQQQRVRQRRQRR